MTDLKNPNLPFPLLMQRTLEAEPRARLHAELRRDADGFTLTLGAGENEVHVQQSGDFNLIEVNGRRYRIPTDAPLTIDASQAESNAFSISAGEYSGVSIYGTSGEDIVRNLGGNHLKIDTGSGRDAVLAVHAHNNSITVQGSGNSVLGLGGGDHFIQTKTQGEQDMPTNNVGSKTNHFTFMNSGNNDFKVSEGKNSVTLVNATDTTIDMAGTAPDDMADTAQVLGGSDVAAYAMDGDSVTFDGGEGHFAMALNAMAQMYNTTSADVFAFQSEVDAEGNESMQVRAVDSDVTARQEKDLEVQLRNSTASFEGGEGLQLTAEGSGTHVHARDEKDMNAHMDGGYVRVEGGEGVEVTAENGATVDAELVTDMQAMLTDAQAFLTDVKDADIDAFQSFIQASGLTEGSTIQGTSNEVRLRASEVNIFGGSNLTVDIESNNTVGFFNVDDSDVNISGEENNIFGANVNNTSFEVDLPEPSDDA